MADDPTFEGWTTPPAPLPPGYMELPTGRRLDTGTRAKGFVGSMTYGVEADAETITYAARHWPQRELKDFEIVDREWRDRQTREVFLSRGERGRCQRHRRVHGAHHCAQVGRRRGGRRGRRHLRDAGGTASGVRRVHAPPR